MVDLYKILGVSEDATPAEIKAAYRQKAFALHPDTCVPYSWWLEWCTTTTPKGMLLASADGNPEASGNAARAAFHELQEAYGVLRDEGKRSQYDAMRKAGFDGAAGFEEEVGGAYGTPWGQPSMDAKDFDAAFDAWWKKMSAEFRDYEEQEFVKERMNAERMARAAAWEWEKQQAQANKERVQKLKWRTEEARMQRHATTLRRFWQTHSGFTLGDAVVAALFLAGTVGIALTWRVHIQEARQGRPQQQQQAIATAPGAATAAAVAAAAGAAAAESAS